MPIRWYGPADPEDPTYRHFERIVNLCPVSYTHLTLPTTVFV